MLQGRLKKNLTSKITCFVSIFLLISCSHEPNEIDRIASDTREQIIPTLSLAASVRWDAPTGIAETYASALKNNSHLFPAYADLLEANLLLAADGFSWLPQITPELAISADGTVVGQVSGSLVLSDWGEANARQQLLTASAMHAQMTLWQEKNEHLATITRHLIEVQTAQSRIETLTSHVELMQTLATKVGNRINAGVGNYADIPIVDLRIQELERMILIEKGRIEYAQNTLIRLVGQHIDIDDRILEELNVFQLPALPAQNAISPQLQIIRAQMLKADAEMQYAAANRIPNLVLAGVTSLVGGTSGSARLNMEAQELTNLALQTEMKVARSHVASSVARLSAEETNFVNDGKGYETKHEELKSRITATENQISIASVAIATLESQQSIGAKPLTDNVQAYERLLSAQLIVIDTKHEIALATVERLSQLGLLASLEVNKIEE